MEDLYDKIHQFINNRPRYRRSEIELLRPSNGIYFMFEKGEAYKSMDRIVRVGSHRGTGRLNTRLMDHYKENHRDSIFRKHIGRCILVKNGMSSYLKTWNLKIKSRVDKSRNLEKIDWAIEKEFEELTSKYISENFSFTILEGFDDDKLRQDFEAKLIATVAYPEAKFISKSWLGNYHPSINIRESGLWNIQHIKGNKIAMNDLDTMERLI